MKTAISLATEVRFLINNNPVIDPLLLIRLFIIFPAFYGQQLIMNMHIKPWLEEKYLYLIDLDQYYILD